MEIPITPMVQWSGVEGRPLVIAGPCAAESREQVFETAQRLAGARVDYLRAGIWKARTRPDNFEGIGEAALPWLRDAGKEYGLKTATEVALPAHVDAALKCGIDMLWIGARTTVNPFSVQDLANAVRGVDVPILIKNPTNPDLQLWLGAIERFSKAGIRSIGAIHRGVSVANSAPYRNAPMWSFVIELRRLLPALPIITDPSHICGNRELLASVAQSAMDLGLDGVMIEAHPRPDQAWSDAAQQVTPERAGAILSALSIRRADSPNPAYAGSIEALRERIDGVDHTIVALLAERMQVVQLIAEEKRANNITTLQVARWAALLDDRMRRAEALGLDPEYARAIYDVIHRESIRRQSQIMSDGRVDLARATRTAPLE
ncbi:MAG: chorismate mutase [Gemmatimonadota bacterium]